MPIYQNRTNDKIFINNTSFSSGETKTLSYYINTFEANGIVKLSDTPDIIKNFRNVITDGTVNTSPCLPITLDHSYILKIEDGSIPPTDSTIVTIGLFVGITDNFADYILYKKYNFEKITYQTNSYWYCEDPMIKRQNVDISLEFFSLGLLSISNGNINLLIKYY